MWFEGEMMTGHGGEAGNMAAALKVPRTPGQIPIVDGLSGAVLVPDRTRAQLAECSSAPEAGNAQLQWMQRESKGRRWPALVQTRPIEPGEALAFWYSAEEKNPLYARAVEWGAASAHDDSADARGRQARKDRRGGVLAGRQPREPGTGRFLKKPKV